MAKYKNSTIYYDRTKSYQDTQASTKSLKSQKEQEGKTERRNSILTGIGSGMASGASTGASAGGWWGALLGLGVGAGIGAIFGNEIGRSKQEAIMDEFYSGIQTNIIKNIENTRTTQIDRNDLITESQYLVNSSKADFISTYGTGSFNMLESTITALLDMNSSTRGIEKASTLLSGLQRDSIVGQIETRLMNQDYIGQMVEVTDAEGNKSQVFVRDDNQGGLERDQIEALNSAYVDISDLGNAYVEYLYNAIFNSDTEIGDQAKAITDSERMQIEQLDNSMQSLVLSNQQKFAELFLNQRSTNVSNAQNLGEVEASSGASGIRASKSSRTSVNATKLSQDIANASYGILINSYKKQLENSIQSGILSREQVYYSSRQQMKSLERQVKASVNKSINTFLHGSADYVKQISKAESDTDEYYSAAEADRKFLQDEGKSVDTSTQYIYSTHSATV